MDQNSNLPVPPDCLQEKIKGREFGWNLHSCKTPASVVWSLGTVAMRFFGKKMCFFANSVDGKAASVFITVRNFLILPLALVKQGVIGAFIAFAFGEAQSS
uniref:Uncharacterized protein n=1 Tax=Micrurus surinamensis TaxID=129470 RepID=A0A2D4PQT2_MICSU